MEPPKAEPPAPVPAPAPASAPEAEASADQEGMPSPARKSPRAVVVVKERRRLWHDDNGNASRLNRHWNPNTWRPLVAVEEKGRHLWMDAQTPNPHFITATPRPGHRPDRRNMRRVGTDEVVQAHEKGFTLPLGDLARFDTPSRRWEAAVDLKFLAVSRARSHTPACQPRLFVRAVRAGPRAVTPTTTSRCCRRRLSRHRRCSAPSLYSCPPSAALAPPRLPLAPPRPRLTATLARPHTTAASPRPLSTTALPPRRPTAAPPRPPPTQPSHILRQHLRPGLPTPAHRPLREK